MTLDSRHFNIYERGLISAWVEKFSLRVDCVVKVSIKLPDVKRDKKLEKARKESREADKKRKKKRKKGA